jgi:hypothetical protein
MAAGRPTVDAAPAASAAVWDLRGARLSLDRPVILGILNVTPDSFSDGGQYVDPGAAIEQAHRMVSDGADLVDHPYRSGPSGTGLSLSWSELRSCRSPFPSILRRRR